MGINPNNKITIIIRMLFAVTLFQRERMKIYLKSRGSGVWDSVVSKPWYLTTGKNENISEVKRIWSLGLSSK
jgi:hypothetical protein